MTQLWPLTVFLIAIGVLFNLAGTLGLLRFPDTGTRLHALSKADNVGLGFIALGLAIQAESAVIAFKIMVIWILALTASSFSSLIIARRELKNDA